MKKNIVVVALLICAGMVNAQSRYYHLVGDTVRGKSPIYFYSWWPTVDTVNHVDSLLLDKPITNGFMGHYIDSCVRILGVASTLTQWNTADVDSLFEECDTTMDTTMYYTLYDATPTGVIEMAKVCWTCDYNTHPKRYMELPYVGIGGRIVGPSQYCEFARPMPRIAPLREYYFDSPIYICDSFYLGWKYENRKEYPNDSAYIAMITYIFTHSQFNSAFSLFSISDELKVSCRTNIPKMHYLNLNSNKEWVYSRDSSFMLVFPIIEVDTVGLPYDTALFSCLTPRNLRVSADDGIRVRIDWDDNRNDFWEVSLTTLGSDPEAGLIATTGTTYYDFYGLSEDTVYSAYVRGYCPNGQSEWSRAVLLSDTTNSGEPTDPEGIMQATSGMVFVLSPNPASDIVTVTTDARQGMVEVLDMQGRQLLSVPIVGPETSLDLTSFATGTYLVRLVSPHGTATRKLSVE